MVRAIVGANWGDEGKGKITDMLAKESDIIIRFQGGSNAGHTIINNYGRFALHLLPSGVFYGHTTSIIGNGVALNIPFLVKELESLVSQGVPMPHILVSDRAQILPFGNGCHYAGETGCCDRGYAGERHQWCFGSDGTKRDQPVGGLPI